MSLIDKNKIFFSLIHYILSEQKNVNWILKTSLIDFTGISSVLEEKPYKKESLLDDVIDYVVSIKPYHVQFSRYFEHYETASETISIPKNDKLETTIHHRFDAIKSTPDIVKIFETQDDWENDKDNLEDGHYYISSTDTYYTIKNGKVQDTFDKDAFINAHAANRLFYLGVHDLEELKKELNANFKGLEVNGHTFNIGEFGYELYNYSTYDYDSPTIIYDYCFIDPTENFNYFKNTEGFEVLEDLPYKKVFETSGNNRFNLPNIDTMGKVVKVFKQNKNQDPYELMDYELKLNEQYGNYIDIYTKLQHKSKIIIGLFDKVNYGGIEKLKLTYAYVINGYAFTPSDSEVLKREFVNLESGTITLKTPLGELDTNKMIVQFERGHSKTIFSNYQPFGSDIVITLNIDDEEENDILEDDHIIITSFDYKYLYDKIYMWEDTYGRSNNIINLDGNKFLRARYESDRPRELVASSPLSSFMAYDYKGDDLTVYHNDYKNDFVMGNYDASGLITIDKITPSENDATIISSITLSNCIALEDAPGKVIINSEIIEYNELNRDTKTISKLRRGMDGSVVNIHESEELLLSEGNMVLPYIEEYWYSQDRDCKYVSYFIKNPKQLEYMCPSGIGDDSYITVKTLNKISLLSDVTEYSTEININSCNVVPQTLQNTLTSEVTKTPYKGNFILKIDNDSIPFTSIYKDTNTSSYVITGFTLPSKYKNYGDQPIYKKDEAIVHGCIPTEFTDYEVSLVSIDDGYNIFVNEMGEEIVYKDDKDQQIYRIAGKMVYDNLDHDLGIIVNDIVYRNDGKIMAKIIEDKFYHIHPVLTLIEGLDKGTILQIKIESVNPYE